MILERKQCGGKITGKKKTFQKYFFLRISQIILHFSKNYKKRIEMTPLPKIRKVLSWLSALPSDEKTTKWNKMLYKMFPLFVTVGISTCFTSSLIFFCRFVSIDLEVSLYALFQICGNILQYSIYILLIYFRVHFIIYIWIAAQFNMLNAIVVTAFSRQKIQAMFNSLDNIFSACTSYTFEIYYRIKF